MVHDLVIAMEDLLKLAESENDKLYLVKDNNGYLFLTTKVLFSEKQALRVLVELLV